MQRVARLSLLVVLLLSASASLAGPALSDVVTAPRPAEGESYGLYLKGQKVGFMLTRLTVSKDQRTATMATEVQFKAKVGPTATTERMMKDVRVYEAKPQGRLLSFTIEQRGDGGDQTLEGTATPKGITVVRRRPQKADETLTLPPAKEVIEDADQVRVALARQAKVEGVIVDATDLEQYPLRTTLGGSEVRVIRGVKLELKKAVSISEKEKVPAESWVDAKGRIVEVRFGPMLAAHAEPEDAARRIDLVEVYGLTRIELPGAPPPQAREVPGAFSFLATGLPEKFRTPTYRQQFQSQKGGAVEVTLRAIAPSVQKNRPLADPNGGANLKSTIVVEAKDPDIVALAKRIAGPEKNAYLVAKAVNRWVFENLKKDYGVSSDRASDVLKLMRGDCTEHSLLAVALLRALGIPAKRVDGVVYVLQGDQTPALYWHEWVEAYVGEWTQLDPTFGQDVVDATHFALGEEANAEIAPLIGSIRVLEVRTPPAP